MKVYDIDISGMEEVSQEIEFITITGVILQIHYKKQENETESKISTWKLIE